MQPFDFDALTTGLTFACAAVALLAVSVTTIGLTLTATRSTSRARALGHPLVALIAAGLVVAAVAAGQWVITHTVLERGFAPTDDGWRRVALAQIDASIAMAATIELQRFGAGAIAVLVPLSWIAAWRHDPSRETSALVASVAATFALGLVILAGCGGILWMTDVMTANATSEAVWPAWHALEAGKWAVAGVAAVGLMSATPIVMHAAARGNAVSARTSQLAQVIFIVGLAAWSTSRFANEDLVRGPMASLERGESAWRRSAASQALSSPLVRGLDLPTASACSDEGVDPHRQRVLHLSLDGGSAARTTDWPAEGELDSREPVLAAAIDRRAPPDAYTPWLVRAQALGVERIAILTVREDAETSLTLGEIRSTSPCVLGWIGMDHALQLSASSGQWTTLAYAASHPR